LSNLGIEQTNADLDNSFVQTHWHALQDHFYGDRDENFDFIAEHILNRIYNRTKPAIDNATTAHFNVNISTANILHISILQLHKLLATAH